MNILLVIWSSDVLNPSACFRSSPSSNPLLLKSVELLISHLDSLARVIVSLQMLKFGKELRGKRGGERSRREKPAAATTSSTPLHEVICSSLPTAPYITSFSPLCWVFFSFFPFSFSLLHIHPPHVSQEAARAGCVYCWGNWSSLERVWPLPSEGLRSLCMCAYACFWWLAARPAKERRPQPVSAHTRADKLAFTTPSFFLSHIPHFFHLSLLSLLAFLSCSFITRKFLPLCPATCYGVWRRGLNLVVKRVEIQMNICKQNRVVCDGAARPSVWADMVGWCPHPRHQQTSPSFTHNSL